VEAEGGAHLLLGDWGTREVVTGAVMDGVNGLCH
jgi:hypothetical protein